tara:strand:- start:56 stop:223 length:168 start_codon:yes stop_codon:yes gene_type:complete
MLESKEIGQPTKEVLDSLEMIKKIEEIVMIPFEDERIARWAMYLDELGIRAELLI